MLSVAVVGGLVPRCWAHARLPSSFFFFGVVVLAAMLCDTICRIIRVRPLCLSSRARRLADGGAIGFSGFGGACIVLSTEDDYGDMKNSIAVWPLFRVLQ